MHPLGALLVVVALAPLVASAQDESYKVEPLKEAPPADLAGPIKEALNDQGYRVVNSQGKPYADFWLRKAVPASAKPSGPKGAILFPILAPGELLGALRYAGEGQDYRDQPIDQGAYTLRYSLQPVDGNHLGVSEFRDYALLVQAAKDTAMTNLGRKELESQSAEAAGTTHPAVLLLRAGPSTVPDAPTLVHDETLNTWEAVVPLSLRVEGESAPVTLPVRLVIAGAKTD